MTYYTHRRINWLSAAVMVAAALCFAGLSFATDSGGTRVTLWLLAAIALLALLTSATISVRVTGQSIEISQGLWATADHVHMDDIARTAIVPIPFMRRFGRAWILGGQEVITAGDDRGVEVWLSERKRSRFFRAMVDRVVIGSDNPEALRDAIERARAGSA